VITLERFIKMLKLNQRNKAILFSVIFLLTISIARISAFIKPSGVSIFGLRMHHFEYGIIILILISFIRIFKKINAKTLLVISGIAAGLIIDELFFVVLGVKNVQQYYSTLLPTTILALIITIIILAINTKDTKRK